MIEIERLQKRLTDARENALHYLENNGPNNIEDYRFMAGQLAAINSTLLDIGIILDSAEGDDDDFDGTEIG